MEPSTIDDPAFELNVDFPELALGRAPVYATSSSQHRRCAGGCAESTVGQRAAEYTPHPRAAVFPIRCNRLG